MILTLDLKINKDYLLVSGNNCTNLVTIKQRGHKVISKQHLGWRSANWPWPLTWKLLGIIYRNFSADKLFKKLCVYASVLSKCMYMLIHISLHVLYFKYLQARRREAACTRSTWGKWHWLGLSAPTLGNRCGNRPSVKNKENSINAWVLL